MIICMAKEEDKIDMKREYVSSKFNVIVKDGERYCVFNSLYGSLAVIEDENIIKVIRGEKSEEAVDSKIFTELCEQGFNCLDNVNEESICNVKKMDMIYDSNLHLNIMPTYECNFRCAYCYQNFPEAEDNFPEIEMTKELQESIVKYVKKEIKNYTGLIVEWYGGEPLLKKDIILQISNKLIEICKKMSKPYFSTIKTNGYLLDVNTFRELLRCKIIKYHVTLDGFEMIHDAQRFLKSGQGTYSVILDNLLRIRDEVKSSDFNIVIRVNVTKALLPKFHALCTPGFKGSFVSIIGMRADMIIGNIGKFLHCLIQTFFCLEFIQIDAFILQCIEITFHRCIVIWISGFAHALCYMDRFAEFDECPGSVL